MKKFRILIILLVAAILLPAASPQPAAAADTAVYKQFNFTSNSINNAVNLTSVAEYTPQLGYGFVAKTNAMPPRFVDINRITVTPTGFTVTEDGNGSHVYNTSTNQFSYGGMVFRIDVDSAGAYGIKVTTVGGSRTDTYIAPSGMQSSRIASTGAWDSAGLVSRNTSAVWTDNVWQYDYVTGQKYIEIEIEPNAMPTAASPKTVGIASIEITKIPTNPSQPGEKPTAYILGDSGMKSYTFGEVSMSGWAQLLYQMFDSTKINVINYSMGGRSFKTMYDEGRFNDVLMTAKEGDFVFVHSAGNDERPDSEDRFGRGSTSITYPKWLNDIYIPALRARGLIPVLLTAMPRTKYGVPSTTGPNGFNPDSPGFLRAAAEANPDVELVELYANIKEYMIEYGAAQIISLYMSIEAGECAGSGNTGSYANGHPGGLDGSHFKESLGKVACKIVAEQIYRQGITESNNATENMQRLAATLTDQVKSACDIGTEAAWQQYVFPEWANDVSLLRDTDTSAMTGGIPTSGTPYYYRNQIEKMLQLGAMKKDRNGNFRPLEAINTNDFISSICTVWALDTKDFEKYYSSGNLTREVMAAIVFDAYSFRFGKNSDGSWKKPDYMTKFNSSTVSPDDPTYDPNLTGAEAQYYPLVGWGNLTDKTEISLEYANAFYEVYNLGLIRSEEDIARGSMKNGVTLQPKGTVSRAKAAKTLYFLWTIGQDKINNENQILTIYNKEGIQQDITYQKVDYSAPKYEFENVNILKNADSEINDRGTLSVKLKCNGIPGADDKLTITIFNQDGSIKLAPIDYSITAAGDVVGLNISLKKGEHTEMYVRDSENKISATRSAVCGELIVPIRSYTVSNAAGIKNGAIAIKNLSDKTESSSVNACAESTVTDTGTLWWQPSDSGVLKDESIWNGQLRPTCDMTRTSMSNVTIGGNSFNTYVSSTLNGYVDSGRDRSGFLFTPDEDGILSVYIGNLAAEKNFIVAPNGTAESAAIASSKELGLSGYCMMNAVLSAGTTYYIAGIGTKGRFIALSYIGGAPIVSRLAKKGDSVQITAIPKDGYKTLKITATNKAANAELPINLTISNTVGTFTMPDSDVIINAMFVKDGTVGDDFTYTIKDVFRENSEIMVTVIGNGPGELIAATYDTAGKLINVKTTSINGNGTYATGCTETDAESIKLFIWENTETLKPLSEKSEFEISDV